VKKEKPGFDLVTINPPLVFGPIVHYLNSLDALNTSNQRIRDFIQGKVRDKIPPTGVYLWVDVRDVAMAHVRAIEVPEAGSNRFFVVAGHYTNKRIVDAIRETHPELESRLPPADSADDLPADIYDYDNKKSREILGLKYISLKDTVGDTVKSLLEVGA
jgi:nucleoside-diphosphate-sugar epimerase